MPNSEKRIPLYIDNWMEKPPPKKSSDKKTVEQRGSVVIDDNILDKFIICPNNIED